jgi:choice-of-anchor B domain-containing protein
MKNFLLIAFIFASFFETKAQYAASNFTLISVINPESGTNGSGDKYSGCWGWVQQNKKKEYAIACSKSGTYFVDITNPATPTVSAFRSGVVSNATWREVKTFQNYCYIISDDGGGGNNSFQIIDMQYLPDSVHKVYDSQSLIRRAHALWVDGNKLYISAVRQSGNSFSTMNVYSLANPQNPVLIRRLDQDYSFISYVHDMFVRNDTVYASCANQGLYIFKLTSANTFTMLGSLSGYSGAGYNHSSALTPNGQTLVFTDEVPAGLPIKVANVSNMANIQILATTNQYTATTPHNPFMINNQYCVMSSYKEGLQLYDISNPSSPFLAGYFDTYPQGGGNTGVWSGSAYKGQWGAYPYFPTKTIFALDMLNGIFLLKTNLYANPQVVPGFNLPATACPGATVSLMNTSTGATAYSWTASNGLQTTVSGSNASVTFSATGIYTISLFASNPSYSGTATHTIAVANLTAAIQTTNSACQTCSTGIAVATVSNGVGPYTYTWLPIGGNDSLANNLASGCYTIQIKDVKGCMFSGPTCVDFYITTGLSDFEKDQSVSVYPNPANTELNIKSEEQTFICRLFNNLGEVVKETKLFEKSAMLWVQDLSPGVYTLELQNSSNHTRKKILVDR